MKSMNVKHNDFFNTPLTVFNQLNNIYSFDVDVACDSTNSKCKDGFFSDKEIDGLSMNWGGVRCFCNPPFSQKEKWIRKAILEVEENGCPIVVMVLPLNCMSTTFFYDLIIGSYECEILKGRIQFLDNEDKKPRNGNNSGTVIVYFKKKISVK